MSSRSASLLFPLVFLGLVVLLASVFPIPVSAGGRRSGPEERGGWFRRWHRDPPPCRDNDEVRGKAACSKALQCPAFNDINKFKINPKVAAGVTTVGAVSSFWFTSLEDQAPNAVAVPGLTAYCIYPQLGTPPRPIARAVNVTSTAVGVDDSTWLVRASNEWVSFLAEDAVAPANNIELGGDPTRTDMGTVQWQAGSVPSDYLLLLQIEDAQQCRALYGNKCGSTCFVFPAGPPVCNTGVKAAYNSFPVDAVNCGVPSQAFQATGTSEFGDYVGLATGKRKLKSMDVIFSSYACQIGVWHDGSCRSTVGATFTHPITANVYEAPATPCVAGTSGCVPGALVATVTQLQTIPYRPSAAPSACPLPGDVGLWFNAASGMCETSKKVVLTFTFPSEVKLDNNVVWSVAFSTSSYGSPPLGTLPGCFALTEGCPYDSLNVGAKTFPNAPYFGTDMDSTGVFIRTAVDSQRCSSTPPSLNTFSSDASTATNPCWTGYRPAGRINTK